MKDLVFVVRGGVRAGTGPLTAFNATWPFAALHADESALVVTCFGNRWVFPKAAIRILSRYRGFVSPGLRIEHTVGDISEFFVFWCFRFGKLQRELGKREYLIGSQPR